MSMQTPLYFEHEALNARIIDFNGWAMPVQYPAGILQEHRAVRENAGAFDTCHMGEFKLCADNVRQTLNCLLTGDFLNLADGRMRYTFITAEDGTVIDDAVVFLISATEAMICVNAGDIPGDFAFLSQNLPEGAQLENQSQATGKIDVQGPTAHLVIDKIVGVDFRKLPFYSFVLARWRNEKILLSRSGYTGSPGVELFFSAAAAPEFWRCILAEGKSCGLRPCGLGARDTLRLEAGLPLYGHELNRATNPLQAGFSRFVALNKAEDFPGRSALENCAAQSAAKGRILCGLTLEGRRTPRQGFAVTDSAGKEIGVITSGGPAPTVGGNIALAYIDSAAAQPGLQVLVDIRSKPETALIMPLPFYKCENLRKISGNLA